ncbi:MAG: pilus assembly protein PilP [Pseudomonadota bacterium]
MLVLYFSSMSAGEETQPPEKQLIRGDIPVTGGITPAVTQPPASQSNQAASAPLYSYNPEGKLDPFIPFIEERKETQATTQKRPESKIPLTPLQKMEIGQISIVGIIVSPNGNRAMVQDSSGKGYIITKGTYIGRDFGKVEEVLKDKIVIHEDIVDTVTNKPKTRVVTLELPKKYEDGGVQ